MLSDLQIRCFAASTLWQPSNLPCLGRFSKTTSALKAAKPVSPVQVGAITLTILGNKSDMVKQQAVPEEEAKGYAESIGAEHHHVSAKTGAGISAALRQTVHRVLQRRSQHAQQHPQSYMPGESLGRCVFSVAWRIMSASYPEAPESVEQAQT